MGILSSLIGGVASLGATAMGNSAAMEQQKREQDFNAKQAELNRQYQTNEREATQAYNTSEREAAQQWNLDMWNKQNEYNDPAAQMQRMVDAGINPNAAAQGISGNGSTAGQVAASSGASSTPGSGSVATTPSIAGFLGENISNSVNTLWQNLAMQKDIQGKQLDNDLKGKELGTYDERFRLTKDEIGARIDEINKNVEDKDADIKLKQQQFDFLEDMNPVQLNTAKLLYTKTESEIGYIDQQIENLKKQYDLTDEQIKNVKANTDLTGEQIKNVQADTEMKEANTDLIGAQGDLTKAQEGLVKAQKLYQDRENVVKKIEVDAAKYGISFGAPDFWNLYNFQKKTGQDPTKTLLKPTFKKERREKWRDFGINLIGDTGNALINAGASWITNPLGMSGAFGSRTLDGWRPSKAPNSAKFTSEGSNPKDFKNSNSSVTSGNSSFYGTSDEDILKLWHNRGWE